KAVIMSAENETSEIIRRRLFEWDSAAIDGSGKVMLPREAVQTCNEYADWVVEHRQQLPALFDIDNARQVFASTYPFHPMVLSVFERKWQSLPRFQRTRGILRLLALWVSRAYQEGFKGAHRDPLIGLGTAPLDDALFRAATFEQLGELRLEVAVTTDIIGKPDAHATRLDKDAVNGIKKARLHRKAATVVFFESNGGQGRGECTLPEVRLAVAEPELDIGNVETVLETLGTSSYYLTVERNKYRFSLSPNLNKLLADRRASIQPKSIEERVRVEVTEVFKKKVTGVEPIPFPEKSSQIPDRPVLTMVILAPDAPLQTAATIQTIEQMTRESGNSSRTFKSALIWCVADANSTLYDEARKLLAWEDIDAEAGDLRLDEGQRRQLAESLLKAKRDLTESVWRTYKNIVLLGKDNSLRTIDLGLVHSSSANTMPNFILNRLRQDGDVEEAISPNFLVRNWSPVFKEWSTKAVRDAFFASPQFPRLLNANTIKDTIAKGVSGGQLAYFSKTASGDYEPFHYNKSISPNDVEISDDVFIISKEEAEAYEDQQKTPPPKPNPDDPPVRPNRDPVVPPIVDPEPGPPSLINRMKWSGEIPPQKWSTFYQRVLSKFAVGQGLKLTINVEVAPEGGLSPQKVDETKLSLRELGLSDDVKTD
ncbi:MAG: ATP-binding protein, partial [Acidobacteriota bacterium]|nr:ATP-binding protein [Acidobacteriota bacterium]